MVEKQLRLTDAVDPVTKLPVGPSTSVKKSESTLSGWIVRLMIDGKPYQIRASSPSLEALAKNDGHAQWIVDTTLDLEDSAQADLGFVDVDTTPVQVGETVYVASFLAGLYGLNISDGSPVFRRSDLTGVTALAADERTLTAIKSPGGNHENPRNQWLGRSRLVQARQLAGTR